MPGHGQAHAHGCGTLEWSQPPRPEVGPTRCRLDRDRSADAYGESPNDRPRVRSPGDRPHLFRPISRRTESAATTGRIAALCMANLPRIAQPADPWEIDRSVPTDSGEIDRSVPTDSGEIDHSPPALAGSAKAMRMSSRACRVYPGHVHVLPRPPVLPGMRACLSGPRACPPRSAP